MTDLIIGLLILAALADRFVITPLRDSNDNARVYWPKERA